MVILFISVVRLLQEVLAAALQEGGKTQEHSATSRETVEAAVLEFAPDLVIVDALHPEAVTLVAAVRTLLPKVRVVVLATHDQDEDFLAWADIGISGYLGPDTSGSDLVATVRRVAAGEVACPPRLAAVLLGRFADRSAERAPRAGIFALTAREREIAELLADGLSNKLIARRLEVALPTVKNHVHSILDKWDLRNRGEAAARYRRKLDEDAGLGGGNLVKREAGRASPTISSAPRNGLLQNGMPSHAGRRAS